MDAISSPVSSLRATVAGGCASTTTTATFLAPHHHQTHLLKPSCHRLSLLSTTKPQSIPSSSRSHHHHTKSLHLSSESHSPFSTSRTSVHQKPSTGYAAALLDSARCGGHKLLLSVDQDVRRFTRVFNKMMAAGFVGGEAVREAAESGGFDKRLVALVRMLLGKGRVEMVGEVMKEFGRICDELSGTRVVVVAAEKRMAEKELAGIAREVQRTTGAAKQYSMADHQRPTMGYAYMYNLPVAATYRARLVAEHTGILTFAESVPPLDSIPHIANRVFSFQEHWADHQYKVRACEVPKSQFNFEVWQRSFLLAFPSENALSRQRVGNYSFCEYEFKFRPWNSAMHSPITHPSRYQWVNISGIPPQYQDEESIQRILAGHAQLLEVHSTVTTRTTRRSKRHLSGTVVLTSIPEGRDIPGLIECSDNEGAFEVSVHYMDGPTI